MTLYLGGSSLKRTFTFDTLNTSIPLYCTFMCTTEAHTLNHSYIMTDRFLN